MEITDLKDTIPFMLSGNYKSRFVAEYSQLRIRLEKLKAIVQKWDEGKVQFKPTCPREIYDKQIFLMEALLQVLQERAVIEAVELDKEQSQRDFTEALRNGLNLFSTKVSSLPPGRTTSAIHTKLVEAALWVDHDIQEREQR